MVVSQKTLDSLESIGLNMYERKIYTALISRGVSTAGELSEMTGVPRSRAYDVLESLADKGFVILKPSKPMEYVAIPPEDALENTKDLHRENLNEKIDQIDRFKGSEAIEELKSLYDEGLDLVEPSDLSGALKGRYNFYQHTENMFREADKEIKVMTTEGGLNDLHENHADVLKEAKDKGVNIRILSPISENNKEAFNTLSNYAEVRQPPKEMEGVAKIPKGRISIVDEEKMTFALTHDKVHPSQDTAFWTKSEHAVSEAIGPMFDLYWRESEQV